jgi:hypothetical protein
MECASGSVPEVIRSLAGLQAQHANSPYVAMWSRRKGQAITDLEEVIEDRTVVKATLMRATLHLVAADDFHAYDVATAESRVGAWASTARKAGVDLADLNVTLLEFCSQPKTVAEMEEYLRDRVTESLDEHVPGGVRNPRFRMASAAGGLVHVPPSGLWKSHGRPSYIDARVWLGSERSLDPTDALRLAVERYLGAYGPASEEDIVKWVGERRITKVRAALSGLDDRLVRFVGHDGRQLVDLIDHAVPDGDIPVSTRFLSRWDSLLIGYEVRDRVLPDDYRHAVIKKNGDFLPTFLVDGFVAGLWSVDVADDRAVLVLTPFATVPRTARSALEEDGEALIRYVEPDVSDHAVRWSAP